MSQDWTPPIDLQSGDTLQNRGLNKILISRSDPASELDALSLAPGETWTARAAMTVRASTARPSISRVVLARGLALSL
ncbi:hypothetical protein [Paracoccus sp. SSK6]|uniref:hypothetical protein n=1 Tax=Paracoccus sp. SSK6 TaxID=3143131 RepID=UPI00321AC824